jgi:hypothetical protein
MVAEPVKASWLLEIVNVKVMGPQESLIPAVFGYGRRPWCARKGKKK